MILKRTGRINSQSSEAFLTRFLNGATTLHGPALTASRKQSRLYYRRILIYYYRHHEEKEKRLIPDDTVAAIQEFVPVKSSVSVIHYLPQQQEQCACEEHTGTSHSLVSTMCSNWLQPCLQTLVSWRCCCAHRSPRWRYGTRSTSATSRLKHCAVKTSCWPSLARRFPCSLTPRSSLPLCTVWYVVDLIIRSNCGLILLVDDAWRYWSYIYCFLVGCSKISPTLILSVKILVVVIFP